MLDGVAPPGKADCKTPTDENIRLANRHAISATPTVIFSDGERQEGAIPTAEIEKLLK